MQTWIRMLLVSFMVLALIPLAIFIQRSWQLKKEIEILAKQIIAAEVNDLVAYPDTFGPTVILFSAGFGPSEVTLDFYDLKGDSVETTDQMICDPGTYSFRFPYFGQQPSGVYFCRLTRDGEIVKLIKFLYLNGSVSSARSKWAGFYFLAKNKACFLA